MTQILAVSSLWLHSLATIPFVGHYLLLSLVYLPAFQAQGFDEKSGLILSGISRRSRGWLYGSLLVFVVTGTYLMLTDPGYLGFMNFGNLWGILMLVKHLLVLGMIGMGFWFNAVLRVGPMLSSKTGASPAFDRFRLYANLMAILGVLVLLLTALAQAY